MKQGYIYNNSERSILENCTLCPRECRINRFEGGTGYCGADAGMNIASICIHTGEEPAINGERGICNIFFGGCNLKCLFCQNNEISHDWSAKNGKWATLDAVVDSITGILSEGITAVGFVSPSHVVPQVKAIIRALKSRGFSPITVYNTNGYDKKETISGLSGMIDVFLPDFKYVTVGISSKYSDASDYPEIAKKAIKEMYFQKGSMLSTDENGRAINGLIIRHLVLPGHAEESKKVLHAIADDLSPGVHISLMSQYHPESDISQYPPLNRHLHKSEYENVVNEMESLGFRNGWIQDIGSNVNYRPDFSNENPFD